MNFKKISLLIVLLLIADQALKIWIKTHMHLDESIVVFPDWFQLRFIENNGAAFGMHIASRGGFDWGKLLLGVFRIVMVGFIGWLMHHLCTKRQDTPKGVIVGLALIFAGAMGNILDSAFYGLIFSESTPYTVAQFGGHYAGFMMGKVVDMFYFPLFQWNGVPPPAAVSGRQQQLFLRRDLQSGRCLHLGGSRLSASVSAQVLQQVDFF